ARNVIRAARLGLYALRFRGVAPCACDKDVCGIAERGVVLCAQHRNVTRAVTPGEAGIALARGVEHAQCAGHRIIQLHRVTGAILRVEREREQRAVRRPCEGGYVAEAHAGTIVQVAYDQVATALSFPSMAVQCQPRAVRTELKGCNLAEVSRRAGTQVEQRGTVADGLLRFVEPIALARRYTNGIDRVPRIAGERYRAAERYRHHGVARDVPDAQLIVLVDTIHYIRQPLTVRRKQRRGRRLEPAVVCRRDRLDRLTPSGLRRVLREHGR